MKNEPPDSPTTTTTLQHTKSQKLSSAGRLPGTGENLQVKGGARSSHLHSSAPFPKGSRVPWWPKLNRRNHFFFFLNEEAEQSGRSWTFPIHFTWTVPLFFFFTCFHIFDLENCRFLFFLFFFFFKNLKKNSKKHKSGASDSAPKRFKHIQRPIFWPKKKIVLGGHVTIEIFWLMNTKRIWLGWPAHAPCLYDLLENNGKKLLLFKNSLKLLKTAKLF